MVLFSILLTSLPCILFCQAGRPCIWQYIFELVGCKRNKCYKGFCDPACPNLWNLSIASAAPIYLDLNCAEIRPSRLWEAFKYDCHRVPLSFDLVNTGQPQMQTVSRFRVSVSTLSRVTHTDTTVASNPFYNCVGSFAEQPKTNDGRYPLAFHNLVWTSRDILRKLKPGETWWLFLANVKHDGFF